MRSGEALEIQVKCMLELDLQGDMLGLAPGNAQIFHHEAYFSKDRDGDSIFDIVLEVRRPGTAAQLHHDRCFRACVKETYVPTSALRRNASRRAPPHHH